MSPDVTLDGAVVDVSGGSFEDFVVAASPRLLRAAVLLTGDRGAAEDLLQEVLERVYVRWSRIDDPAAYCRQALARRAANRWRSRGRRPEVPLAAHDVPVSDDRDLRLDLVAALRQLTPGQRAVIVLRFFEDLDVAGTARTLGISAGTVKSQTARALPRLRELLGVELSTKEDQ